MENRFEERYQTGHTPWDHGTPDDNLIKLMEQRPILKCNALDIGCGTGDNVIWLAQQQFEVTGCDISNTALVKAREKAALSEVDCSFILADFLTETIPGAPFGFIFDRGCLHSFTIAKERRQFAKNVVAHLEDGGLWLSLVGNADEQKREVGPPQLTATELTPAVEPYCEIISMTSGYFGSPQKKPPQAWICLMQKRTQS